jgi:thiamine biosynthesis lipoprotein
MATMSEPRVEHVMGTVVSLRFRDEAPRAGAVDAAFAWLREVDARFSTYRSDSEIRRLDRGELLPRDASGDVRFILDRCVALRRETDGYFDVRATGRLDPSALVKGWAAERAAELLVAAGARDFCLNAGGDVVARGRWRVGVQHPLERGAVAAVVDACDLAVATSGAYERGAHIVDPVRGDVSDEVLSVTVTGPDLGVADAYSTAAFAMGGAGPAWTLRLDGYEALTILASGSVLCTPGFPLVEDDAS